MAASKGSNAKKAGGSKKTGTNGRRSTAGKNSTVKKKQQSSVVFLDEILFLIALAVSILLLLGNLHLCGSLGERLYAFMHGATGVLGYVFPFFLFGGMVFFISNRENLSAMLRLWAAIVAFWLLCGVFQLFAREIPGKRAWELAAYFEAGQKGIGGGVLGGVLNELLRPMLGVWGMAVVLIIGLILLTVLITGRSFFQPVKRRGKRIYSSARQDMYHRKEQYDEHRAQARERKRQEKERLEQERREQELEQELENQRRTDRKSKGMVRDPLLKEAQEYGEIISGIPDPIMAVNPADQFEQESKPDMPSIGRGRILSPHPDENETMYGGNGAAEGQAPKKDADSEADWLSAMSREMDQIFAQKDMRTLGELNAVEHSDRQAAEGEGALTGGNEDFDYIEMTDLYPDGETALSGEDDLSGKSAASGAAWAETKDYPEEKQGEFSFKRSAAQVDTRTVSTASGKVIEVEVKPEDLVEELSQATGFSAKLAGDSGGTDNCGDYGSAGNGQAFGGQSSVETSRVSGDYNSGGAGQALGGQNYMGAGAASGSAVGVGASGGQNPAAVQKPVPPPAPPAPPREYHYPPVHLLTPVSGKAASANKNFELKETAIKLQQTLKSFGVGVSVTNISCGPAVTRFEVSPEQGVKVSKIVSLTDDIKLNLAAADIRIEAPIPGKAAVGIEVPNKEKVTVFFRELIESEEFRNHPSKLAFAVGKDLAGKIIVTNLASMPHLLIAGATGSGKSVCINTLIMSLLCKAKPDEVKLIMVDPKVVELSVYNGIPHLLIPVVTDPKKAAGALNWAVAEMDNRYNKFAEYGVRDLAGYNEKIRKLGNGPDGEPLKPLPQIVIIVDELADLMMVAPGEVEDAICRLAQLARAAGLHLVLATQRPSVNVITGLIKANMPSRIAFAVSSGVDSRTILDMHGAEKLLGKGDMLFSPAGYPKPVRLQGAFISDTEVSSVVQFLADNTDGPAYQSAVQMQLSMEQSGLPGSQGGASDLDAYFVRAGRFVIEKEKASSGMLQRAFKIGFNRAARIVDQLAAAGVVGDEEGTKARKILMTMEEFETYLAENQIE